MSMSPRTRTAEHDEFTEMGKVFSESVYRRRATKRIRRETPLDLNADERDEKDDAEARAWSRAVVARVEAGDIRDDFEWGQRRLAQERRNLLGL